MVTGSISVKTDTSAASARGLSQESAPSSTYVVSPMKSVTLSSLPKVAYVLLVVLPSTTQRKAGMSITVIELEKSGRCSVPIVISR